MKQLGHPLPIRVEFRRQLTRKRTLVAFLLIVALPLIVVAAVKFGPSSDGGGGFGDGDLDLVGLATAGGWNFALTMVFFASGFLLLILIAMFCGDTVASEASWSTLRYLLISPVPRRRLLFSKLTVALILSAISILILIVVSYLIGLIAFGSGALSTPTAGPFTETEAFLRIFAIGTYVFLSLLFAAGIAFLMSVITDIPLAAVGTAVVVVIVSNILGAIEALGALREWLPTNFANAWIGFLNEDIEWTDINRGISYSVISFMILITIAVLKFDRKDITS
ncbi:MAG: ABC transporter permease [Candidatus Nanopelagicales bacterium]|jgi:ABC-2 type transport system permease protein|nr:ABC transporter permease subunit [Actinomycetota bacterium]MDA9870114.1 ABC transporter permease [bacterium]MBT5182127.1 ABC transporter permease subunit [Actinomycetota bacterium]MBT5501047.1 ABC transporter permease subunit [Actinomycetota bacterium]MBT5807551.1 ABC transporter permease subunit [Actinomycetota bacterium]